MTKNLENQTKNAIEYMDRLFYEISYLVKEIEGQLLKENFAIGLVNGYQVSSRTSSGLESHFVQYWMPKTFSVFFCEEGISETRGGQTFTKFKPDLKLLLIHIDISSLISKMPIIYFGVIHNIKPKISKWSKWEYAMIRFSYDHEKIFENLSKTEYSDNYFSFKRKFKSVPLFEIKDSESILTRIINPMIKMYSTIK